MNKFKLLNVCLFDYTRLVEVQGGVIYLDTIWYLPELQEMNGASTTVNFNGDLNLYDSETRELLKKVNLMELNSFIKSIINKEKNNRQGILDVLMDKYNLSPEEFNATYERYKWHMKKCKELFKKDNGMKVILKDKEEVCPVCYSNTVKGNYCSICGQRITR